LTVVRFVGHGFNKAVPGSTIRKRLIVKISHLRDPEGDHPLSHEINGRVYEATILG
jgi:hypothetical protein